MASILDEAVNVHKRRKLAPAQHLKAEGYNIKDKRVVLTADDLSEALKEVGQRVMVLSGLLVGSMC